MEKRLEVLEGNTKLLAKRGKNYTFTSFGEKPRFIKSEFKYMGYGKEICPKTKKRHWQGFCIFINKRTFNKAKKIIQKACRDKCHVEVMKGSIKSNLKYCKKEGKYRERGELPDPGKRTDLIKLKDKLYNGKTTIKDIVLEKPHMYHQYGRTLNKIEDYKLRNNERTEAPKCIWYWGETGVGKSHKAYENTTRDNRYTHNKQEKWWDKYEQQDYVILNDYRGEIPYGTLLELLDKWPFDVIRRGREPIPFNSKYIIITAPKPPEKTYYKQNEKEDNIKQLLRRIEVIELKKNDDH